MIDLATRLRWARHETDMAIRWIGIAKTMTTARLQNLDEREPEAADALADIHLALVLQGALALSRIWDPGPDAIDLEGSLRRARLAKFAQDQREAFEPLTGLALSERLKALRPDLVWLREIRTQSLAHRLLPDGRYAVIELSRMLRLMEGTKTLVADAVYAVDRLVLSWEPREESAQRNAGRLLALLARSGNTPSS